MSDGAGLTAQGLLRLRDAAARLQVCEATVRRYVASGELVAVRMSGPKGSVRFTADDLAAFIEARRVLGQGGEGTDGL